jgi:sigma-B regulation protein RsbU (phosphoserine phosphatase)
VPAVNSQLIFERVILRRKRPAGNVNLAIQHAYRSPGDARRSGGDFALVRRHLDGAITFVVTDLWAKGPEAEHYILRLQNAFEVVSLAARSPARVLSLLNQCFVNELESRAVIEGSASAFAATCDTRGELRYASAGADGVLLFRGPDRHYHLESTGPLLGIADGPIYSEQGFTYEPGDLLVVCTDGVTEARKGGDGRAFLGTGGLAEIMRTLLRAHALPTCDELMRKVANWIGGDFHDDATALFASAVPAAVFSENRGTRQR